jgi:exosome complex RNA-binding protein Rrp4
LDDFVIGVIKSKLSEFYVVDIGGPNDSTLGIYEFEGATKKNRPIL